MRVTHTSFHQDPDHRQPEALLDAWPTLLGVASALVRAGVETSIVQASSHDAILARGGVHAEFVNTGRFGGALRKRVVRAPRGLLEAVARSRPDVVHVNGLQHPLAIHDVINAFPGTPVVVQDHASTSPGGWRRHLWRYGLSGVAGVAFTVREQSAPFVAAGVLSPSTAVFTVLEGSSAFTPGVQAVARAACGLHGNPCLLWTGHLDGNKDPLMILGAFERAVPHLADARLWCCFGAAPLLDPVRRRIDRSPTLRERVTLLGRQPHAAMETYFRAADFFVQGSHREGCSYSSIEALACGTPPLVTNLPSSRRIVGDAGSLTPVDDADALADAIVEWARRDRAIGRRAARARFERELSFDSIGRDLRDAYERVARPS
jgi:glycosyltransferase involved in cell wall biosynthesis